MCASCYVTARRKAHRHERTPEQIEKERAYFTLYRRLWREEHPEQGRANQRKFQNAAYDADRVKHRQRVGAARYHLTVTEYQQLIAKSTCDACGNGSGKTLHVDHDHVSGQIRGVLCVNCNTALGRVNDDPERLRQLITYLQTVSEQPDRFLRQRRAWSTQPQPE